MGHAYEPERNYDTSLGRWRNLKFKSFETPQYCVKVTSGDDDVCRNNPKYTSWDGGAVELHFKTKDFTNHVATLNSGENEMEYCLPIDQVNLEDDIWTLQSTSKDGVCITSLTVNNEQLLVGKNNDQTSFWLDQNDKDCSDEHMSTDVMTIQNGEVYYSECKQDYIRRNDYFFTDLTMYWTWDVSIMLNLEENTNSGWSNIFGFQEEGTLAYENGQYPPGSRTPAVWLRPNSNALHVCSTISGNGNVCWNSPEMPVNTWFKLHIRQFRDSVTKKIKYQILIDDEVKRTMTNNLPRLFQPVNGIIGNTYQPARDYKTVRGQFKEFTFTTKDI